MQDELVDDNQLPVRLDHRAGPQPGEHCIHRVFEAQVAKTPDAIAVGDQMTRLTYRELNDRANQVARFLRQAGVRPNSLVGLCLERQPELVVGILGILKAGGAYVPIDLAYPKDRVAFMLSDAHVSVLITQSSLVDNLPAQGTQVICLDRDLAKITREDTADFDNGATPDDLAYVIYTSGSTGMPKGSLISHYNVVRLFTATAPWYHFDARDVWTLFHSSAFDFSVWEIWGALFYGGRLVVVPFEVTRTPEAFYRLVCAEGVTVLNQTPSAFRQLIRTEEAVGQRADLALRYVIFGGEALDMKTLQPWFDRHGDQRPQLVNMYGITETTVHVSYRPLTANDITQPSVIGVPIPDLTIDLLDDHLRPVAAGEPGEICVGGAGLGRGYLNRPDLTAQKFISLPIRSDRPERLYRSGDLGRYLPNGDLEYLGRIDHQVKIRGFRVELGEIESVLGEHPSVRESVVLPRDDARGEKRLVAYVIFRTGREVPASILRQSLRQRLPEYMVPSVFACIDQLPLTTNGKLDVNALPNPTADAGPSPVATAAPRSELEEKIAAIWQEVLKRPVVGRDESFFDIGGNSLSLAEIHVRLQKLMGYDFPIVKLFEHPTVGSLAGFFDGKKSGRDAASAIQDRIRRQREALAHRSSRRR